MKIIDEVCPKVGKRQLVDLMPGEIVSKGGTGETGFYLVVRGLDRAFSQHTGATPMTNSRIDDMIRREFWAEFLGAWVDGESVSSVRVYENQNAGVRVLVEVDPDHKATVFTFHKNLK